LKVEGFDRNDYYGTVTAIAVKQYASTISPHIKLSYTRRAHTVRAECNDK